MSTQQVNPEVGSESTTSINHDDAVLKNFAIAITVIIIILVICIVIFLYKRKLRKLTNNNDIDLGSITHLKNTDDGEYNSLDYYSTDYADNRRIDPERNDEVVYNPDGTKGNRKFFIYAKNNAIMTTKEFLTRSNTYAVTGNRNIRDNKNTKSLSDMKIGKKDTSQHLVTTGNSSLKLNKTKNGSILDVGQISSPVSPVSGPSTSIYNIERVDSLANMNSRHAPSAPVPSITSNKKYKEILRGPQMISISNTSDLTHKNTHSYDTPTNISIITNKNQNEILRESQMTNDLTGNNTNTSDTINIDTFTNINNTEDTSSIISNVTPVILPKKLSIRSIRSNGSNNKLSRLVSDSLYFIESSNTDSIISESQDDDKNESTIEVKDEDSNKSTIKGDEEVIDLEDLEGSYERLSRETNLFQKPMYKIT